jgi:gamma-glutamylputrescine oxidase
MNSETYYHATATEPFPSRAAIDRIHHCRRVCDRRRLCRPVRGAAPGAQRRLGGPARGIPHRRRRLRPQRRPGTQRLPTRSVLVRIPARRDFARQIWSFGIEAREHLDWLIRTYNIDAQYLPGLLHLCHKRSYVGEARAHVEDTLRRYPDAGLRFIDQAEARSLVASHDYYGGYLDSESGHLHALNLALGMARAASQHGARLFEDTAASRIARSSPSGWEVHTNTGATVKANSVVIAGNGYLRNLQPAVEARVMPINNFVLTTEPLGRAAAEALIRERRAISDSRFVVYYFRITPDDRLLFGGGETYSYEFPKDIAGMVRGHMLRVFPQLQGTRIEHAWGGTLAITTSRLPFVRELEPGLFNASGFSGQGIVIAPFAGKALAEAIGGNRRLLNVFEQFPLRRFPGGKLLRWPVLVAAMSWFALRDHL